MSTYSEKLRDPRWQKKRLEILNRDEFTCQICKFNSGPMHVHHLYYDSGSDPWDYPADALLTLCPACHEEETMTMNHVCDKLIQILKKQKFLSQDIINMMIGFTNMREDMEPENISAMIMTLLLPSLPTSPHEVAKLFKKAVN